MSETINVLQILKKFLLSICNLINNYEEINAKQKLKRNLLFISITDEGIYLNELKIIDKKSKLQVAIFKILLERHVIGYINLSSTGINTIQISNLLREKGFVSFELEKHIRQCIYRIKKT